MSARRAALTSAEQPDFPEIQVLMTFPKRRRKRRHAPEMPTPNAAALANCDAAGDRFGNEDSVRRLSGFLERSQRAARVEKSAGARRVEGALERVQPTAMIHLSADATSQLRKKLAKCGSARGASTCLCVAGCGTV